MVFLLKILESRNRFDDIVNWAAKGHGIYIMTKNSGENFRRTNLNWLLRLYLKSEMEKMTKKIF